jgi:hypothetical protein
MTEAGKRVIITFGSDSSAMSYSRSLRRGRDFFVSDLCKERIDF